MERNAKRKRLSCTAGAVLPLVMMFSLAGFLAATIYFLAFYGMRAHALRAAGRAQALFNARAGAAVGLHAVRHLSCAAEPAGSDSGRVRGSTDADRRRAGLFDGMLVSPYTDSSFGLCSLRAVPQGCFLNLIADGFSRLQRRRVETYIGSRPFSGGDTVLIVETASPIAAQSIQGAVGYLSTAHGGSDALRRRFEINGRLVEQFRMTCAKRIGEALVSAFRDLPTEVTSAEQFFMLQRPVNGDLLIKGTYGMIVVDRPCTLSVMGDVQFTGDARITDLHITAGGEIRVFDRVTLTRADFLSHGRLFLQGRTRFQGTAVAMADIEILHDAAVDSGSLIVAMPAAQTATAAAPAKADERGIYAGREATETAAKGKERRFFSIYIRDRATVDGVVVNISETTGIYTQRGTRVRGVLWAHGPVAHGGELRGVIRAKYCARADTPEETSKNEMEGSIAPLEGIETFTLPFFAGIPTVLSMHER